MLDRLVGACLAFLTAAFAVYVAVRLIESVTAALIVIAAVIGGLVIVVGLIGVLRRRRWPDRW